MGGENMKKIKRAISVFLCVVMILGILPFSAIAAGGLNSFSVRRSFSEETFTDVESRDWFYDNVRNVYELGLMIGNSPSTFNPNGNLTLAEAVTIAARLHSIYQTGSESFQSGTPWYQTYVDYSKANGILLFEDLAYGEAASRAEFAEILAAALPKKALSRINPIADGAIPDVKSGDSCAAAVYQLYRAGVLIGNDAKGTFAPDSSISRCEAAAIISRMAVPSLRKSITLPGQSGGSSSGSTVIPNPASNPDPKPGTTYTVTFRENAGDDKVSAMPDAQRISAGACAVGPALTPVREGYVFIAWLDEDGDIFDFDTAITADTVLFAAWKQNILGEDGSPSEYLYEQDMNAYCLDDDGYAVYYPNLLDVFLAGDYSEETANAIAEAVGGTVAGQLTGAIPFLQLLVHAKNYAELQVLADRLMERNDVLYACCDVPVAMNANGADENPWPDSQKREEPKEERGIEANPNGNDWWAEAIRAYTGWTYSKYASSVKVGVIDTFFDLEHKDIKDAFSFLPEYRANEIAGREDMSHGTHVAGIIAARNNKIAIRGVADFIADGDLVCADWRTHDEDLLATGEYLHIIESMLTAGVKVINCSFGLITNSESEYLKVNSGGDPFAWLALKNGYAYDRYLLLLENDARLTANLAASTICSLLEHGHKDFLIVQSAGNGYNGKYKDGIEAVRNGFFASITAQVAEEVLRKHTSLSFGDILEHVIIVGGVDNARTSEGFYKVSAGSNYGSCVTICAPGKDIISLNADREFSGCISASGTSGAAPMVSGAAALVWGINPGLSAGKVRYLLTHETNTRAAGNSKNNDHILYPMLDVGMAAKAALESVQANGTLLGKVYRDSDVPTPVAGAQITVYHNDGSKDVLTADINGAYSITLPKGEYRLEITASGYETKTVVITVERDKETTVETFLPLRSTGSEILASGKCGDNLTWSVSSDGTLTISGTGEMYNYKNSVVNDDTRPDAPWKYLKNKPTRLVLEAGITRIGDYAFERCWYLSGTLTIPSTVKEIGKFAFMACKGFAGNLNIPVGVTSIQEAAFDACSGLSSVKIPQSLTCIGDYVFFDCAGLTALELPGSITSIGGRAFGQCAGLTGTLIIPQSVKTLGDGAFAGCAGLKSVQLPDGLKEIPDFAFSSCTGLEGVVTIPAGVKNVGIWAFYGCNGLKGIRFLDSAPSARPAADSNQSFPKEMILYYPQDNTSWLTGSAYDKAAGTWNGYMLKPWNQ